MAEDGSNDGLTISVVIPSVGRGVLADIVGRALEQDALEVIVVADANPDDVHSVLMPWLSAGEERVRMVAGPGQGVALARQTGVEAARGDIVLLLDDDVVPEPGLLEGHRRVHAAGRNRVVIGYLPVAPQIVARSVAGAIYSSDYEAECRELDDDPSRVLLQLWAGNYSMRSEDCIRVPHADPMFLNSLLEDQEFGFRCRAAGLEGFFDRSLSSTHHYERPVSAFLKSARAQALASRRLHEMYPDLAPVIDGRADLPKPARLVVQASLLPGVGPAVRTAVVWVATKLGASRPNRLNLRTAALAREVVQAAD
ncbi:MAG: glycosyltransferase family A protein [Acidimicrobiia bacterium]